MKKCLVIINPNSGKGKLVKKLDYIRSRLSVAFDLVDVVFSERRGHVKEIVEINAENYHTIVVCGGDGTVHEAVNGLMNKNSNAVLGFISSGTVNDFARNLGINSNVDKCLDVIVRGEYDFIDVMKNHDEFVTYVCGFGVMTSTSYATDQSLKKKFGAIAYVVSGVKKLFRTKNTPCKIEFNDRTEEKNVALVLAFSSKTVGGMPLDRLASIRDGKMDVIIFYDRKNRKYISIFSLIKIAFAFLFGIKSVKSSRNVIVEKTNKLKITSAEKINVNVDGEKGVDDDLDVVVLNKRLKVYANKR